MFYFQPENWGRWSNLTNIDQMGWSHQLGILLMGIWTPPRNWIDEWKSPIWKSWEFRSGVIGCTPIPTWAPYGKSLYKPHISWVLMDYNFFKNPYREQTGSTISTLLHEKINPKKWHIVFWVMQGFSNFLGLFQVIMANPHLTTPSSTWFSGIWLGWTGGLTTSWFVSKILLYYSGWFRNPAITT